MYESPKVLHGYPSKLSASIYCEISKWRLLVSPYEGRTSLELLTSFISNIFELSSAGIATEIMMKVLSVLISK